MKLSFVLLSFYLAGILLSSYLINVNIYYVVSISILLITSSFFIFKDKEKSVISTICTLLFLLGIYLTDICKPIPSLNDLSFTAPQKKYVTQGIVISEAQKDLNKISFDFSPDLENTSGKVKIFIYDDKVKLNYGDRILLQGKLSIPSDSPNPNEFSYKRYLELKNIFSIISVNSSQDFVVIEKESIKDFDYYIIKTKENILSILFKKLPQDSASLLSSLIFGAKASPVNKDISEDFLNLGLAHVLAASGMQVSLIVSLGLLITKKLKLNIKLSSSLVAVTVIFYMLLTGLPPSILRAGLVSLIILVIGAFKEDADSMSILFFAVLLLTLFDPFLIYDLGFIFSILATFSLLYLAPIIYKKMDFLPDFFAQIFSVILSAQLFVLPVQIMYFPQFSPLFVISNLIASLFVDILTYMVLFTVVFGNIFSFIADFMSIFLVFLINIFIYIINYLSNLPFSLIYLGRLNLIDVLSLYSLFFLFIELVKREREYYLKSYSIIFLSLGFSISSSYSVYNYFYEKDLLKINFINVGQGDSTFIQTPQGKNILIDCGQSFELVKNGKNIKFNAGEKYIIPYLRHLGINKLDTLVVTHPDSDHVGGCESILNTFEVKEVWDSGQTDESTIYQSFIENVLKNDIVLKTVSKGQKYTENNLSIEVINDTKSDFSKSYNNNNAIVLKLIHNKKSFLFTADIEKESESKLIDDNVDLKVDVLKVGHHGSKTSSTQEFLEKVKPEVSVISVGENNIYHHPSKSVIERLNSFKTKIYRTDKDGGIVIKSDGENLDIETSR